MLERPHKMIDTAAFPGHGFGPGPAVEAAVTGKDRLL